VSDSAAWVRVNDLFNRALELPADARAAFLDEASGDDPSLRGEVESLLAAHDRAADFIERPAAPPSARESIADHGLALVGRQYGHYRIQAVLGEGGMGVVYLAEDTRLGRPVALKALAPRLVADPAGRERLMREARAAAALSHPGIATVYALEEFDRDVFIAFEYVPGETLRSELARGLLPLDAVVDAALGVARALAAAHDRGIVHRDLKPENVIRTPAHGVKVLDFGLARFREPAEGGRTLTLAGAVLGTPAYMSPEQIRAEPIDARSDLFSFGVLLYELLCGVNPFLGVDQPATIANVLERDPPAPSATLGGAVRSRDPRFAGLEAIALRCLRKARAERFASGHDVVSALEVLAGGRASGAVRSPTSAPASVAGAVSGPSNAPAPRRWWWQFHQAVASVAYLALLVPLWLVHEWRPGLSGMIVFLAGLTAALVSITLRLHLWFTLRSYPEEWHGQRRFTGRSIRLADVSFAAVLLVAASFVLTLHASVSVVFVASAVAIVVSSAVIEPVTTRAAFGDSSTPEP
jgi:serine/threonine-protein kinase